MSRGFEDKTDNTYLPNTSKGWEVFRWQQHCHSGRALLVWTYYVNKEKEYRKNKKLELGDARDA